MSNIDTRRTRSRVCERSRLPCRLARPLRSSKGITMSLLTIMARATVATMTIPVAAEKPPRKASTVSSGWP